MRVLGGQARGRFLRGTAGVRPTAARVRAALFSALEAMGVQLGRVLDLYAGSGVLGIEALSRGALWCDFVERDPKAWRQIRRNLEATGLAGRAFVHCLPVERALVRLKGPYSLVVADPPYDDPTALAALERLASSTLVEKGKTVLVLEHRSTRTPPSRLGPLQLVKSLHHGDSALSFYQ
jgi:16S rRNA (guanine966-N2)-methyltransferase